MGTSSADWRGFADWNHDVANGTIKAIAHVPHYDFGDKSIDTTYGGTLVRADIVALHDAAVTSQAAFETEAASRLGSWWTSVVSACDAAGCQGADHVKVIARMHYRGPVTLT